MTQQLVNIPVDRLEKAIFVILGGISQFVTSTNLKFSKRVTAFTEQCYPPVLRSKRAIAVNVEIMRRFVRLQQSVDDSELNDSRKHF